jgi:hypothetical protein
LKLSWWLGRWDRGHFRYNAAVNNIPAGRVSNVYRAPVPQRPSHQESFNGGNSPWHARPTAGERRFEGAQHPNPTPAQTSHEQRAFGIPEQRMGSNHGMPPTAATPRPGGFGEPQVERARPAQEMRAQQMRPQGGEQRGNPGQRHGNPERGRPNGDQH